MYLLKCLYVPQNNMNDMKKKKKFFLACHSHVDDVFECKSSNLLLFFTRSFIGVPYKSNGYASEPDGVANYDSDYVVSYSGGGSSLRYRTSSTGNQSEER